MLWCRNVYKAIMNFLHFTEEEMRSADSESVKCESEVAPFYLNLYSNSTTTAGPEWFLTT